MTEQEYCDLSDLQLFRSISISLRMATTSSEPNRSGVLSIQKTLNNMIAHLEPIISKYLDGEDSHG